MECVKLVGQNPNVCFIGGIEESGPDTITDYMKDYPEAKIFLCVTNGDQPHTEDMLKEEGWEELFQGDKDIHPRQREKDTFYIKLWVLNLKEYSGAKFELYKNNILRYKEKTGYEFLNWPVEKFQNIGLSTITDIRLYLSNEDMDHYHASYSWPFIGGFKPTSDEHKRLIKEVHTKFFGFVLPDVNPFTNRNISSISDARSLIERLKNGDHLKVLGNDNNNE